MTQGQKKIVDQTLIKVWKMMAHFRGSNVTVQTLNPIIGALTYSIIPNINNR